MLDECARRLGLPSVPRLLMEDDPVLSNAGRTPGTWWSPPPC
ncbi:hypothetical protein NKG94_48045 [Micromonospora sp. M12]